MKTTIRRTRRKRCYKIYSRHILIPGNKRNILNQLQFEMNYGAVIKPHRIYIANRTRGNFSEAFEKQNHIANHHKPLKEEQAAFQSSMNSYLGIMKHYKTYKLRKRMLLKNLSGWWWNYMYLSGVIAKFV